MTTTDLPNPTGAGYFNAFSNGASKQQYVIDPDVAGNSPFGTVMEIEDYAGPGAGPKPALPMVQPSSTTPDDLVVGVLVEGLEFGSSQSVAPGKVGTLVVNGICQVLCDSTTTAGEPLVQSGVTAGCARTAATPTSRTIGLCLEAVTISSGTALVWAWVNPGSQTTPTAAPTSLGATAITGDLTWSSGAHGPVLHDQSDGHTYRIISTAGVLSTVEVT